MLNVSKIKIKHVPENLFPSIIKMSLFFPFTKLKILEIFVLALFNSIQVFKSITLMLKILE